MSNIWASVFLPLDTYTGMYAQQQQQPHATGEVFKSLTVLTLVELLGSIFLLFVKEV